MKRIAVIAAHPGDEVLGCGGTIAKHVNMQDEVYVLILTQGSMAHNGPVTISAMSEFRDSATIANNLLGVRDLFLENFPYNMLDDVPRIKIVEAIEVFLHECDPDVVYTHHVGDLNKDNRVVHEAVVSAAKPEIDRTRDILFFEVQASTEWTPSNSMPTFVPNWFVNVQDTLETKIEALKAYGMTQSWPHPRSLEAITTLSMWRGSSCGCEAAEAFVLGRKVN